MLLQVVIIAVLATVGGTLALRAGRVALERMAERAEGAQDDAADVQDRHRRLPIRYLRIQRTRLSAATRPLEMRREELAAERREVQAAIDAAPKGVTLVRKLLGYACLLLLPALWMLSCYQLIPSFYTLTESVPLSVFGGALVAAVEVLVAFLLARVLFRGRRGQPLDDEADDVGGVSADTQVPAAQARQRRPAGRPMARRLLDVADNQPGQLKSLLAIGMTVAVAGVLIWGQYEWAPLHDTVGIGHQLAVAKDQYQLDLANNPNQKALLTAEQEDIATISTRLSAARARDEALAVVVPLGEDVAVLPAVGALAYAAEDLRRRRRRLRRSLLTRQINALDREIARITDQMTLETQTAIEGLGHDPAMVTAAEPPADFPPVVQGTVISDSVTTQPADTGAHDPEAQPMPAQPAPTSPVQGTPPNPAEARPPTPAQGTPPVTVDDLFPLAPPTPAARPAPADEARDRRWTDPI